MSIIIFIFGLIMGSFYNVVGLRLPNNESIIKPGSHCPKCQHKLSWYENIPVLSYIFLGGRCKSCNCKIPSLYLWMELLTGFLFLISYLLFGISENFYIALILSSLLVIIFVSDARFMIILDSPLLIGSILIFIIKIIYHGIKIAALNIVSGIVIFGIVYLIMLFGNYIFKKESLGGGDIKLSFVAGLVLGLKLGIAYIILASFLAFPYAIYVTIKNSDGMLPFGPFLVTSLLILFLNYNFAIEFINKLLGF